MNAYMSSQDSGISWPPPLYPVIQECLHPYRRPAEPQTERQEHKSKFSGVPAKTAIDEVRRHYVLPVDSSVLSFLTDHPAIVQILLAATPRLKQYFGTSTIFSLRTPVDESGVRTLYAVVIWAGEIRDVRNALARFDDEWWLAHSRQAPEYLVFTYELV